MQELERLGSVEVRILQGKLQACLRFALPQGSERNVRNAFNSLTQKLSDLDSILSNAEWWEHVAGIDQTDSDYEHASREREAANNKRSEVSSEFSIVLNSLGSKEAIAVAKTAIRCEIEAARARNRGSPGHPLSRFAEFQTAIIVPGPSSSHQRILEVYAPIYEVLTRSVDEDEFLYYFSRHHREFEVFIADCYKLAGWEQVELTPQRGDGGRDVIATRTDIGTIRILEQTKAYSPGTLVSHDDVRAMIGVLGIDHNASKGIITTTSDFQPTVMSNPEFSQFMPYRLELRNGSALRSWLAEIRENPVSRPVAPPSSHGGAQK